MFATLSQPQNIRFLVIAFGTLSAAIADADDSADELAKLQGTWKVVTLQATRPGRDKMEEVPMKPDAKLVIQGGKLIVQIRPRGEFDPPDANVWPFTLDLTTSPKRMVITEKELITFGMPGQKPTVKVTEIRRTGIYALDGNRLRICMRNGAKEKSAPQGFPVGGSTVDEPTVVFELERESPGTK
jgi:uncharacterized protein (TIGR03067 family)